MKSNLTNDIRRLRNKLKIFEMEGSGQLLYDVAYRARTDEAYLSLDCEGLIKVIRAELYQELERLLAKQEILEQGKLEL